MDTQAAALLTILKRPAASSDAKVAALNELKSDIKHFRVPENAQATVFECLKIAIAQQASSSLANSAFSALGHLVKRLKIQDVSGHAIAQLAPRLFPSLLERLGDLREPIRISASQALADLYPFCTSEVEHLIRDDAIGGSNARAKQTGMQWVLRMHSDEAMPFKSYVQAIVARLEDADGSVRDTAKNTLVELFKDAPAGAKTDLKRQLKAFSVRNSIENQILLQIGSASTSSSRPQPSSQPEPDVQMAASTRSLPSVDRVANFADSVSSEAAQPAPPETVPMDPIYMHSRSELEESFRTMLPYFDGKETEQNWTPRDKSILKLRRMTKGNAPSEYHAAFMAGVRSMVEGILKVANSLRTTMSTNGCHLVQELAQTLGPALDPHVEMFLQSFIKMCAATKHIASENGKQTVDAIFQNCGYNRSTMQHVWHAAQEKNAQTRQCTPDWLRTILKRQASYKSHFESSGGLDLAEKCIAKGLDDANPKVKEGMRATYWTFAKTWPDKAHVIMSKLDPKSKSALERDANNPNASLHGSHLGASAPAARGAGASSRNNLREMMAEQRKAKAAGKFPDRPSSAMAQLSPAKMRSNMNTKSHSNLSHVARADARVASTASTASATPSEPPTATKKGNSLMSGPVRRPRRPEMQRPQTADPYASKKLLRPETPANATPANSSPKGTGASKMSIPTSSAARNRAKTSGIPRGSPVGSPGAHNPHRGHGPPLSGHMLDSRPTSKGSDADASSMRGDDDFTMVMPTNNSASADRRPVFLPGHKRSGLGQAMSVDSGVPAMAEEDGFTMVMPDLQNRQQRAESPLAYRSPLKAMFEDARVMVESFSPKLEDGAKIPVPDQLVGTPRSGSPTKGNVQQEEVQIYEDPFVANGGEAAINDERKVLAELPVNENVRMQSPTQSNGSNGSPVDSPQNALPDARSPALSSPQDRAEVVRNKRLLASGIERICAKTLDAHGLRRMQDLARSDLDIWDGSKTYDNLMGVLLHYLETFDQEPRLTSPPHKAAGLKAQALGLVRALLTLHPKKALPWCSKALVTLLKCRGSIDPSSIVATDLDKAADDAVKQCSPDVCIDGVVEALAGFSRGGSTTARSTAMALAVLRRLLDAAKLRAVDLGPDRKIRLVQTTAKFLDDADAEVRKADVELASDLFELFGSSKTEFWNEFRGTDEGRLGLLTYYIARRGKAQAAQ